MRTGVGQGFDPRGDVNAVAVEVIALDDHVAEFDADAQFDPVVRFDGGVPLRISKATITMSSLEVARG